MLTAIVMIAILLVSVTIHELAHYFNARSVGIPVRAFSVGFGPVLWRRQWRGTEWRLSLIPLGGYVDLPGMGPKVNEDGRLEHPDEGMARATLPQKLWVLVGGVIANFLLGVALVAIAISAEPAFRAVTSNLEFESVAVIGSVAPGSAAERLGLLAGDRILSIGGVEMPTPDDVRDRVQEVSGVLALTVERTSGDEVQQLSVSTDWPPALGERLLGVGIGVAPLGDLSVPFPQALGEAAAFGVRIVPEMVVAYVRGFGSVITGRQDGEIAGPVGIVSAVNQATQVGPAPVLMLAALINLSLAVFNLLPIPGLDGGRMLLAVITSARGRPFAPGQEETIHFFGIMAVLLLLVLVTFGDIGRLFGG